MKCPQCGKELKETTKFCDNCGCPLAPQIPQQQNFQQNQPQQASPMQQPIPQKDPKKFYQQWYFWVIIAVVITIVVYIYAAAISYNSNFEKSQKPNTTVSETVSTVEEQTTAEEITTEPATKKQQPTEKPTAKPTEPEYYSTGQTYKDGGLEIQFNSAETYTGYDEYSQPKSGNKVIRAYFTINNNSNSEKGIGSWDFDCYVDGTTVDTYYCLEDDADELDSYVNLSKGRTAKGYIYYEVPENADSIEIEYKPQYGSLLSDNDPVVFKVQ